MKKEICWETVEFLLHEAIENLERLNAMLYLARTGEVPKGWKRRLGGSDRITEAALEHALSQAYRNLNFAWNARFCQPSEMDRDFAKKGRFPRVFVRQFNASESVEEG